MKTGIADEILNDYCKVVYLDRIKVQHYAAYQRNADSKDWNHQNRALAEELFDYVKEKN